MNNEEGIKILEETAKALVEKMGFKGSIYTAIDASGTGDDSGTGDPVSVEIQVKENSNFLIGRRGGNLSALQHILRILIKKKTDQKIRFNVDVNNYRQQQTDSIVQLARETAKKALDNKKTVVLDPMNAFERRLVHMEISKIDGLITESDGEGDERKVIIKPVSL